VVVLEVLPLPELLLHPEVVVILLQEMVVILPHPEVEVMRRLVRKCID
jgi:hypothetical protein